MNTLISFCQTSCIEVIQDVLWLLERSQNVVIIQVFDPELIPANTSCFGSRQVALSKTAENKALDVTYINKLLKGMS